MTWGDQKFSIADKIPLLFIRGASVYSIWMDMPLHMFMTWTARPKDIIVVEMA